jgi:hypothetical protein
MLGFILLRFMSSSQEECSTIPAACTATFCTGDGCDDLTYPVHCIATCTPNDPLLAGTITVKVGQNPTELEISRPYSFDITELDESSSSVILPVSFRADILVEEFTSSVRIRPIATQYPWQIRQLNSSVPGIFDVPTTRPALLIVDRCHYSHLRGSEVLN